MNTVSLLVMLPILFWLAVFTLVIVLIVKFSKKQSGPTNEVLFQKVVDSIQLQQEFLQQQQRLAVELKEINNRIQSIEKILKEVE
ncbi:hypothetical protein [Sporosarcina jiandibaonis]|uniref:hypothetical protein n=1 Tax=Sporosarcina jiandibaonis TaxID=2715535 RepID=UPI0015570AE4|nr:hypothetical protein [Sporosarcina jiandibaonis]